MSNWRTGLVLAAALSLLVAGIRPVVAQDGMADDLTFQGAVGGGTIAITVSADRTGVLRFAVSNVTFEPDGPDGCGTTFSGLAYFDPPEPVVGGSLDIGLIFPGLDLVQFEATFVTETKLEGSVGYGSIQGGPPPCYAEDIAWTAGGPIDTPPALDDLLFKGSFENTTGDISVWMSQSQDAITAIALDSLLPGCFRKDPIDVRAFFQPPVPRESEGRFLLPINFLSNGPEIFRNLTSTFSLVSPEQLEGHLDSFSFSSDYGDCFVQGFTWQAELVGELPPTPTPAISTATPATAPTASPTATASVAQTPPPTSTPAGIVSPKGLPAVGAEGGRVAPPLSFLVAALGFALLAGGTLVYRRR